MLNLWKYRYARIKKKECNKIKKYPKIICKNKENYFMILKTK